MTDRQSTEPSALSQFLATNQSIAPDYVVRGPDGDAIAAKWHRPASRTGMHSVSAQHTLMYHVRGSTSVAKFVEGRCVGTRSQHGSLTFSPRDERNEWVRGGVCEVMHVYIAPSLIRRYGDENLASAATLEIDPMFAVHDPWLQSYFGLLQSEFETFGGAKKYPDALLLTQSMELLIRHLVCWHSNLSPKSRRRAVGAAHATSSGAATADASARLHRRHYWSRHRPDRSRPPGRRFQRSLHSYLSRGYSAAA